MKCPPHIRFVYDDVPGYTRIKKGKRYIYLDKNLGKEIKQISVLNRIEKLVIPPIWKDVWICKDENGHLQVTGKDLRKRKQYIYHPDWVEFRQLSKYSRLKAFGESLPKIRRGIEKYINEEEYTKEKVLAISLKLLDNAFIRVGNDIYEVENETYGLTTLRRKHLSENEGKLTLNYQAKSGKIRTIKIRNRKLTNLLKEISELPGYEVFRFQSNGQSNRIDSSDVNGFIQQLSGDSFTAKDFRTWAGTVRAIDHYPKAKSEILEHPKRKFETALVRLVAKDLGNTVAICRQYYIHPDVMDVLVHDRLEPYGEKIRKKGIRHHKYMKVNEQIALAILEDSGAR